MTAMTARPRSQCQGCSLSTQPIRPDPFPSPLMFVGEAPGHEEERTRRFFVGKAGQEKDNYLSMVSIPLDLGFTTNVLKCRPPGDRDPKPAEILACSGILLEELLTVRPQIIGALGRFAARFFLGSVDMEQVHGIPFRIDHVDVGDTTYVLPPTTVVPIYHPAAGLHESRMMSMIMADFQALADVLHGKLLPRASADAADEHKYEEVSPVSLAFGKQGYFKDMMGDVIAIDTETEGDRAWCLSFCSKPGKAYMVAAEYPDLLDLVAKHVSGPGVTTLLHNALFDLPVLDQMGVRPSHFLDTMSMAYLLQTEPQGLKALAYRHLNMKMKSYTEMVAPYTGEKVRGKLEEALGFEWPKPDAVMEWVKGQPHIRQPQSISRRIRDILRDYSGDPEAVDILNRWRKVDGREMVEAVIGPVEPAYLSDIPDRQAAVEYASRDADATFQLFPILFDRIQAAGLEDTLRRDMGAMPMVSDMQLTGMPIDRPYFKRLSADFQSRMDELHHAIEQETGGNINPGSSPQVSELLYNMGILKRKGSSTDRDHLEPLRLKHKIVDLICQWRAYDKLNDSYINVLPKKADSNSRIHTTLRMTRVITGRLSSSDPNLMAQPVRTEDGRKIRGGFVASPGCSLVSGDYNQVEMRVVAHLSQDPVMIAVFQAGDDIHAATASEMFGIPISEVDEMEHRYPAKRVGFGMLTQIGPDALLRELVAGGVVGWTAPMCRDLIERWFKVFDTVRSWTEGRRAEARRYGAVRDLFGRMRLTPEVKSTVRRIRLEGERQAINGPIQMSAQGIIKEAMGRLVSVYRGYRALGYTVNPLIQIHDDLVWEVSDDALVDFVPEVERVMVEAGSRLCVPVTVDMKVGGRWNQMKKWGEK